MADNYVSLGGVTYKVPEAAKQTAADALGAGGKLVSQGEAQDSANAQRDLSYVDDNWGTAGKLGAGVASGLTLGMGPGYLAGLGAIDPGQLAAAKSSGLYTAGDIAGTVAPALLSGGESLGARGLGYTPAGFLNTLGNGTERLLGSVLGESTGVLGNLASKSFQMAGRGAVEGAAINLGHTVGDNLMDNKPLSAQAMLASGVDGALMGGLMGAGIGTVGHLGSSAVDSLGNLGKTGLGRRIGDSVVASRMGVGAEALDESGSLTTFNKNTKSLLERGGTGAKIGDSDEALIRGVKAGKDGMVQDRWDAVRKLDTDASAFAPSTEHLQARINGRENSVLSEYIGTAMQDDAMAATKKVSDMLDNLGSKTEKTTSPLSREEFHSQQMKVPAYSKSSEIRQKQAYEAHRLDFKPVTTVERTPATWENLVKSRDQLSSSLSGSPVKQQILQVVDDELQKAMIDAAKTSPALDGIAEKYAAGTTLGKLGEHLEETLGKRQTAKMLSSGHMFTPQDMGFAATGAVLGHPLAAATGLLGKGIARRAGAILEPAMAQMAFDMSVGTNAAAATRSVQAQIGDAVGNFFKAATKTPVKAAQVVSAERHKEPSITRKSFEEQYSRTEQLLSENHQDKVRKYTESLYDMGYQDYAKQLSDTNNKAVQYATWNMPPRQSAKGIHSLRKTVVPKVPTLQEYKFGRVMRGIQGSGKHGPITTLLKDLESGTLSRDQVNAFKYHLPDVHAEVVGQIAMNIRTMKEEGKAMSMNKIAQLGLVLDAPIDSTLTPEFIGAVQTALNAPPPEPNKSSNGNTPTDINAGGPVRMGENAQSFLTPTERMTS